MQAGFVYQFRCPSCGSAIWLPRQSPLGTDGYLRYQPTDIWPVTLLCLPLGRLCTVPQESIHQETAVMLDQGQETGTLWLIELGGAPENSATPRAILAHGSSSQSDSSVVDALLAAIPSDSGLAGRSGGIAVGSLVAVRI